MKTKTIIGIALAAAAVFLLATQRSSSTTPPPRNPAAEPPPPRAGAAISQVQAWVVAIMSLYNSAEWLWQPGGPLYGRQRSVDEQLLNQGAGLDSGWA